MLAGDLGSPHLLPGFSGSIPASSSRRPTWSDSPRGRHCPGGQAVRHLLCRGESPVQLRSGTCQRVCARGTRYDSPQVTTGGIVVSGPTTVNTWSAVSAMALGMLSGTTKHLLGYGRGLVVSVLLPVDTFSPDSRIQSVPTAVLSGGDGVVTEPLDQIEIRGRAHLCRERPYPVSNGRRALRRQPPHNQLGRDLPQRATTLLSKLSQLRQRLRREVQSRPHGRLRYGDRWGMRSVHSSHPVASF